MRLLVTGGAGFIGSNFIRYRLAQYGADEVVNLDLLTYAGDVTTLADVERDHPERYSFIKGDIADQALVSELVAVHTPDVIVNFAAETHNSRSVVRPDAFVRTNVLGTQCLLDVARLAGGIRVHHISTCEVYGDLPLDSPDRFTESSPYRPRTPYNATKASADMLVRAYHETFGLPVTITNCANNYGPWQHPEKVIPLFTTKALDGLPLPLYRQSENRREWLHVEDHCRAIDAVLSRGRDGETYNVGSGVERSIEQIADAIIAAVGASPALKTYVDDRPGHDRRYLLDHTKIADELGWKPLFSFEAGLRDTVAWYRSHEDWWRPKTAASLDEFAWAGSSRASGRHE